MVDQLRKILFVVAFGILLMLCQGSGHPEASMFVDRSELLRDNPSQLNYGIAVSDIDGDGRFELIVAGFGSNNLVLKWNGSQFIDIADPILADVGRRAIGVAACDVDGDGQEEIYILNTDTFGRRKRFGDRLFQQQTEGWQDLFSLPQNQDSLNLTAGRSVACVDRNGNGQYGVLVASYGGPIRLYEMNSDGMIEDVAPQVGLDLTTGGRGVISLPLISKRMDIFMANERGPNYLFRNLGEGQFEEIAQELGLDDPQENGRGVAVLDANQDGVLDIVYGNWQGPHRMFVQMSTGAFEDIATPQLASPSQIRTVIAADFDNDGYEELFFNHIGEPNRLFGQREGQWVPISIGDALESQGLGTGAAVGDFDGDGRLELTIAHGEAGAQPLTHYHGPQNENSWIRILPLTPQGAPARGAIVRLHGGGRTQIRAIDAGSGYLCQMEPVAHFGLGAGNPQVEHIEIQWPDGQQITLRSPRSRQLIRVPYPQKDRIARLR